MDSAELLDLLGNANRRRILRLLSRKPCYVTEISEYLNVSPKAVIDHLRKLEEAGLVESRTDDQRRKYFSIARNVRLEVNVSPYEFGTRSGYPASAGLDITRWRHVSVEIDPQEEETDLATLASDLENLQELEQELSMAQRWVQGRLTDVLESFADAVEGTTDPRLAAELVATVADDPASSGTLAETLDVPADLVTRIMERLAERGAVERADGRWRIAE
jgi:ArsR family transcriptional regulator